LRILHNAECFWSRPEIRHVGPSMSEAKMKPRRGNGTPHPKGRRSLVHTPHEEHNNQSRRIQQDEVGEANQNESRSSLQNLIHVHTQVTQTLHQVPLRLYYEGEVKFFL
jgi:hypothetical protein